LLVHHELRVPVWPVGVGVADLGFVAPVSFLGAAQSGGKIRDRIVGG
jgi:hypothetical protein